MNAWDVVIIGRGPAGSSAALYMARAGLSVLMLGRDAGALERAHVIENYYGLPQPVSGMELHEIGIRQAERFGAVVRHEEVISVEKSTHFEVKTAEGNAYEATAVLLATGKPRQGAPIKGFEELRGKGLSFCATCDGFLYRGKRLAVIGSGDYAVAEASELLHFSKDVTLFTNGAALTAKTTLEGVPVVTEKIDALVADGDGRLSGLSISGKEFPVDGAFAAIGTASAVDFAQKIGVILKNGNVLVDENYATNVEGLYAAGDCTGGYLQVAKAVSDGAHAARGMLAFVRAQKKA